VTLTSMVIGSAGWDRRRSARPSNTVFPDRTVSNPTSCLPVARHHRRRRASVCRRNLLCLADGPARPASSGPTCHRSPDDDDESLLGAQAHAWSRAVSVMPWGWPRAKIASHTARRSPRHVDLEARSPVKETRTAASARRNRPSPHAHMRHRLAERSILRQAARAPARQGPLHAMTAHSSVVEVSQTSRSGHSVWSNLPSCQYARRAAGRCGG